MDTTKVVIFRSPATGRGCKGNGSVPLDARLASLGHVTRGKGERVEARRKIYALLPVHLVYMAEPDEVVGIFQRVNASLFFVQDSLHSAVLHPAKDLVVR